MNTTTLENWLWDAACSIRGPLDAPKFKDYILPLLFYKRLSDVYEDEIARLAKEYGEEAFARALAEKDRKLIRFYIPSEHTWNVVRRNPTQLGQKLTSAMVAIAKENPELQGVIDRRDFNATESGQRVLDDATLAQLMEIMNRQRLGLEDVDPDILGKAYEYLLRKFAEGAGSSAGEFYTPSPVALLMAYILDPEPGESFYDPTSGSAGLLIKSESRLIEKTAEEQGKDVSEVRRRDLKRPLKLYGQEINPDSYAMARMNAIIHDMEAEMRLGNTMKNPAFLNPDGSLRQFDKGTANPMWNQKFASSVYENDTFDRFESGVPPSSSADWGWIQHIHASLKPGGKMAVILDTGAASRGSGNVGSNKERDIRKEFVEKDQVECVILLPENMFYNTPAPGIILVIRKGTERPHPGEILIINASRLFTKGRPKNEMREEHVRQVYGVYKDWKEEEGLSAVITKEEAARNDYNLSPSRYVSHSDVEPPLSLEEALVLLAEAEEERAEADEKLDGVLTALGFGGWRNGG